MNDIIYITFEETISVYSKTIEKSGGGFSGIRDEGGIRSVLEFIQNDLYYPTFIEKLSYLVFRFCSGHFFNDTATTEIYTLSLHDALPISENE